MIFTYRLSYAVSSTTEDAIAARITDILPAELETGASSVELIGSPHTTSTSYTENTRTAEFLFQDPLPAGSTGELKIKVKFTNGSTPHGTAAVNTAVFSASNASDLISNEVTVYAKAQPQFTLSKDFITGGVLDGLTTYEINFEALRVLG